MPANDVKTVIPAAEYKTRIGEFVVRNLKKLERKRVDFYAHFVQVGDESGDGEPLAQALVGKDVVPLLIKTFRVPDGNGGFIDLAGFQVMEWFDLLGEEICTEQHTALVARVFPNVTTQPTQPTQPTP